MRFKVCILLIYFIFLFRVGQSQNLNFLVGLNYGGPIPTEIQDSTSGKPIPGLHFGLSKSFPITSNLSFQAQLFYSFRGVSYQQSQTRDTIVSVTIGGTQGFVPTFYTADIQGKMKLHYIDIPLLLKYQKGKFYTVGGLYGALKIGGYDKGNVHITIGNGGFYDDIYQSFNSYSNIRWFDMGIILGGGFHIYKNIGFEICASRSFLPLYKSSVGNPSSMYNTFGHFSIIYSIKSD